MSAIKGFQAGIEIVGKERTEVFQTIQKTHLGRGLSDIVQHGAAMLETIASSLVDNVNSQITLPANNAKIGHIVQNKATGFEFNVIAVDGDIVSVEVKNGLSVIGTTGDFFAVKQFVMSQLNADGAMEVTAAQGPTKFVKDAVDIEVTKDTINPNNTAGLPVEIVGADGAVINITAGDINVQTSHAGVNPDSMRIGDGTNLLAINANLEAETHDNDLNIATGEVSDAPVVNPALDSSVIAALKGILTGVNSGDSKLVLGQASSALSSGVVLSTEQEAILTAIKTASEGRLGSIYSAALSVADGSTLYTAVVPVYMVQIQNQSNDILAISVGGSVVGHALQGAEVDIFVQGLTGIVSAIGVGGSTTGNYTVNVLG